MERCVGQLKRLLKKCGPLNQLQIHEMVYCLVQDMATRQWNKEATVISIRTSVDGTVVSYLLDINGYETARHRRFMRKLVLPDDIETEGAVLGETGLVTDRESSQAHGQPAHSHAEPQLVRRSDRLAGRHGII